MEEEILLLIAQIKASPITSQTWLLEINMCYCIWDPFVLDMRDDRISWQLLGYAQV